MENSVLPKQFIAYVVRWQLSTPILALVIHYCGLSTLWATVLANFVGACIFFYPDNFIFKKLGGNSSGKTTSQSGPGL